MPIELLGLALRRVRGIVYWRETSLIMVKTLERNDSGVGVERADLGDSTNGRCQIERIREHHAPELLRLRMSQHSYEVNHGAHGDIYQRYVIRHEDKVVRERLRKGYQGFLVRRDEDMIGHLWWVDRHITPTHPDLAMFRIDLSDGDVYAFSYLIAPQQRGGGIATDALLAMEARLAELGYRRVWGSVDAANTPARWLYMVSGWSVAHTVRTVRLLGLRRGMILNSAQDTCSGAIASRR